MTAACELVGVTKRYGDVRGVTALDNVNIEIQDSAVTVVEGPSGSGKTSLLNIVGLLDTPTGGRYFHRGQDTSSLSERDRGRLRATSIGFAFQSFHLLSSRNVIDNVALGTAYVAGNRSQAYQRALEALEQLGMARYATTMPHKLSGGEQQRVAIARALSGDKRLLLCDEPTGNLDSENTAVLLEILLDLSRNGVTVIAVTHDPQVAAAADHQITLRDGSVIEQ